VVAVHGLDLANRSMHEIELVAVRQRVAPNIDE
jgi:hypothetical protein